MLVSYNLQNVFIALTIFASHFFSVIIRTFCIRSSVIFRKIMTRPELKCDHDEVIANSCERK